MNIQLESLQLIRFNEEKHKNLMEELVYGNSRSEYIYDIAGRLLKSKNNTKSIYQSAFIVEMSGQPLGYLYISNMVNDEVFLEYEIAKNFRGMGYGSKLVQEVTDYLFQQHNIKSIRLDIDPSNKNSTRVAENCGYTIDEEEFVSRGFKGRMQFVKESEYYVSKRIKK